ncbi:hypothetical protein GXW82_38725 [Streptacidiphilus sp. 4-A2]|nr:hypothetical protein [Streptacidiphilus sp. 4-A2]
MEFPGESFNESYGESFDESFREAAAFREAETTLIPAADPLYDTGRRAVVDPAAEPIPGDPAAGNLPVRYGGGASTELDRTVRLPVSPAIAEPGWDEATTEVAVDGRARTGGIVVGDLLVTVNAPEGSSITPCPPGQLPQPGARRRRGPGPPACRRRPPVRTRCPLRPAAGPARPGPLRPAHRPAGIRPHRRAGHRCRRLRGSRAGRGGPALRLPPDHADLLQELFAATHDAPGYRPGRQRLRELLRGVGAVVVVDDIEFGGEALEELLDHAPECAFLVSAGPDISPPSPARGWRRSPSPACPGRPASRC